MMTRLDIEAANDSDRDFLAEMVALTMKTLPHLDGKSELEIKGMALIEVAGWEPGRDFAFIARANQQRVGAIWFRAHGERSARHYELNLAIAPPYQGQGIGAYLMEYGLDYCARHNGVSVGLKVYPGNLPAMRLYRRFGFEEVTLEMRKKL